MTGSIILSENNLSPSGVFNAATTSAPYNKLYLNMRGLSLNGRKIGLRKMNLYYSWPNVRKGTTVTIGWKIGASFTNYTWTIPPLTNYNSMTDLNSSLQTFCIANGLYHITSTGSNVYYLSIGANANTYKIDLTLFKVPTSLPAGYTAPSNFAGYPTVACTPQFTLIAGELTGILGMSPGLYDGGANTAVFSSTFVPQITPVSCVYMTCNVAKNDVPINGSTVISVFTTRGTDYGAMVEVAPTSSITFYDVDSNSNMLEIGLYDQDWNALYVQDPQITVHLEVV